MNLNEVIKNTLINLAKEEKVATPNEYRIEFCKEAKRQGVFLKECEDTLTKYIEKLPHKVQNDVHEKKISTESDLLIFLISELNRVKLQENREFKDALINLSLYLLKVITLFKDKESSELASITLSRLSSSKSNDLIALKDKWKIFCDGFNLNSLNELSKEIGKELNPNLQTALKEILDYIKELKISTKQEQLVQNYKNISSLIIKSMVPSTASNLNTTIITLDKKLKNEPELITSINIQQEILRLINQRKELDREEYMVANRKSQDVLMNLIRLSNEENFKQRILDVKNLIGSFDNANFEIKKMELMNIIVSLEHSMSSFNKVLDSKQEDINSLQDRIKELELKLNKLESEKEKFQGNFATKVFEISNIQKIEKSYQKGVNPYFIAIIRLDNYSQILNSFGEKTWNAIVHTLKKIIQKSLSESDVFNQMDVKTFLIFLNNNNFDEVINCIENIREAIAHSKFVYKNETKEGMSNNKFAHKSEIIEATISVGVANRDEDEAFEFAIKKAMDRLNIAKKSQNVIVHQKNMASFLKI